MTIPTLEDCRLLNCSIVVGGICQLPYTEEQCARHKLGLRNAPDDYTRAQKGEWALPPQDAI